LSLYLLVVLCYSFSPDLEVELRLCSSLKDQQRPIPLKQYRDLVFTYYDQSSRPHTFTLFFVRPSEGQGRIFVAAGLYLRAHWASPCN